ncbi:hypothetical protein DIQ79_33210, partial [Mycolicibacterium smegmatis]
RHRRADDLYTLNCEEPDFVEPIGAEKRPTKGANPLGDSSAPNALRYARRARTGFYQAATPQQGFCVRNSGIEVDQ